MVVLSETWDWCLALSVRGGGNVVRKQKPVLNGKKEQDRINCRCFFSFHSRDRLM